jgi:hypothetical protein
MLTEWIVKQKVFSHNPKGSQLKGPKTDGRIVCKQIINEKLPIGEREVKNR